MTIIQQKIRYRRSYRPLAEINVVPYIDVMLVLLVIFMITAPLLMQGVNVNLPKAQAQALAQNKVNPIVVSVDVSGKYYLNITANPDRPIAPSILQNQVTNALMLESNSGKQRPILVKGDERVNYGKIVEAMVLLKRAGAKSVGLITEPKRIKY